MVPGRSSNQGKIHYTTKVWKILVLLNSMSKNLPVKKGNRLLHSFCALPKADFNTREKGEKIILILRAHPITQLPWIFNSFVFVILIVGLNVYLRIAFSNFFSFYELLALNIFLLAVLFSYIVINITSWFFNVGIVTNKRVLDLDYQPLTFRNFSGTKIENIEDISSISAGPFSNIFRYGNVIVQTAGTEQNIEFLKVPYPDEVVKIINKLITKRKNGRS